jgi:hypothetical protein
MPHALPVVIWAGFVATILSAAFFWAARAVGATRFDAPVQLGCLVFSDPRHPRTETLGFGLLLLLGTLPVALVYAYLLRASGWATIPGGALLGFLHASLALAALPLIGTISACARRGGTEAPGVLGIGWGRFTPLIFLLGHAFYGVVLALALEAFGSPT